MTIYSLDVPLFLFGTSRCSMSSSNCYFLNFIQLSQEADQGVWYFRLFKIFSQFVVMPRWKYISIWENVLLSFWILGGRKNGTLFIDFVLFCVLKCALPFCLHLKIMYLFLALLSPLLLHVGFLWLWWKWKLLSRVWLFATPSTI